MDAYIKNNKISYDGRKQSLIISNIAQNYDNQEKFLKLINGELLNFINLIPKMKPEHLTIVRWSAGYKLGHPTDYYGIGAIGCESIKPWKHHSVDHLIQHKKPFSKIPNATLITQISLDYTKNKAVLKEGQDSMYNFYLETGEIEKALETTNLTYEYDFLDNGEQSEDDDDFDISSIDDYIDITDY